MVRCANQGAEPDRLLGEVAGRDCSPGTRNSRLSALCVLAWGPDVEPSSQLPVRHPFHTPRGSRFLGAGHLPGAGPLRGSRDAIPPSSAIHEPWRLRAGKRLGQDHTAVLSDSRDTSNPAGFRGPSPGPGWRGDTMWWKVWLPSWSELRASQLALCAPESGPQEVAGGHRCGPLAPGPLSQVWTASWLVPAGVIGTCQEPGHRPVLGQKFL